MKYDAYIFDLDGVICHTDKYHYQAWKKLADRLGIDFNEERNNLLRGVSRMESLELVLNEKSLMYSDREKLQLAKEKNETYVALLDNMSKEDLSREVRNTLIELKEKGKKIAIGSSSKNARLILEKLEIADWFDVIVDGTDIKKSKPDPEVFLLASERLGVEVSKCLVIEDALSGVEAGIAGKFDVAGVGDAKNDKRIVLNICNFSDICNS